MPKKYDKRIVTHTVDTRAYSERKESPPNDEDLAVYSNGYVISADSYSKSIDWYNQMASEAMKDFPELKSSDIECFVVANSTYNKGFAGIRFPLQSLTAHSAYTACQRLDFNYTC